MSTRSSEMARGTGQSMSEWVRTNVLDQAKSEAAKATEETVRAEVLALRTLLRVGHFSFGSNWKCLPIGFSLGRSWRASLIDDLRDAPSARRIAVSFRRSAARAL